MARNFLRADADNVLIPDSTDWDFGNGGFTISHWIKGTQAIRTHSFSLGVSFTNNIDWDFNDGSGLLVFYNGGGGNFVSSGSSGDYTDGNWHNITITSDNVTIRLYIDGVQTGTDAFSSAINADGGPQFGWSSGDNFEWTGDLAEGAIWKGATLSAEEVAALANGVSPLKFHRAELKGYWPLWGVADPEPDLSGNSHNSTSITAGATQSDHAPVGRYTPRPRFGLPFPTNVGPVTFTQAVVIG